MFNLYKKELFYYLNNPIGYIITILFAAFANFFYIKDIFVIGSASLRPFFNIVPWLLVVFIPAVTMRAIAEEKRVGTLEVLLTLPVSETQIVLSKFFALLTVVGVGLFLTFSLPISLFFLVRLYLPEVLVGYFGLVFLAAVFISISLFFSSQTKNQVVAFLLSTIVLFFLLVISTDFISPFVPKYIQDILIYFTPLYHLDNFVKGVVDFRSVFYFISILVLFLLLTIIDLEYRD